MTYKSEIESAILNYLWTTVILLKYYLIIDVSYIASWWLGNKELIK